MELRQAYAGLLAQHPIRTRRFEPPFGPGRVPHGGSNVQSTCAYGPAVMVVAGETSNTIGAAPVAELESVAAPDGTIEHVDITERFCPELAMVSLLEALSNEPTTEPLMTTEFALHPVTEIRHLNAVSCIGVRPDAVAPVAARLPLPSHADVNGTPATTPPLQVISTFPEMDCGALLVGVPEVALLAAVPTSVNLLHLMVTLPTVMYTGLVAVAVKLPLGLTTTLAPAPAAKLKDAATTKPTTPNLRNMPDIAWTLAVR
jgi:hypothetical protein